MPDNEITPDLDEKIRELARDAPLPPGADHERFVEGLRAAFRIYLRDRRNSWNDAAHEIRALWGAARRKNAKEAATRLSALSELARWFLTSVGPGCDFDKLKEMIADPQRQAEALRAIERACARGGGWVEGRLRPSGRRSRSWRPILVAPTPVKNPPRHEAEIVFVTWLEVAWLDAAPKPLALTANPERPGPFARFLKACLIAADARHVDPVGLINDAHAIRRRMTQRALSGSKA